MIIVPEGECVAIYVINAKRAPENSGQAMATAAGLLYGLVRVWVCDHISSSCFCILFPVPIPVSVNVSRMTDCLLGATLKLTYSLQYQGSFVELSKN